MARNKFVLNATSLSKARSSWIQSKSHKTSIPFGKVVPLGAPIEVLPGDTFGLDMGAIIRSLTPKAPLMDSISGDVYAYFVPHRLVFDKTKEFFGQNESEAWTLNLSYQIPAIKLKLNQGYYVANGETGFYYLKPNLGLDFRGSLLDHFETPLVYLNTEQRGSLPATSPSDPNLQLNALPFRGYQIIWNEDFRNPAVVDPDLDLNYDHSDISPTTNQLYSFTSLKPVMRYRDLFTSALKAPQRGPSVTLPLGSLAPLVDSGSMYSLGENGLRLGTSATGSSPSSFLGTGDGVDTGATTVVARSGAEGSGTPLKFTNLMTDLRSASAATINTIRQSIALQHLYEMMTNAFRYNEYTEVFFGVRGSDATLQRPQHLGGIHFRFNINEVVSTAENTSGSKLGQTGAFGTAEIRGHVYTNSFTEHGYIYVLVVLRKEHTYVQGLDKLWRKRDFLDIFQPPLANIGNVDIKNSEVFFKLTDSGIVDDDAFAYTEPYYEYRYMLSKATGLMNPMAPNSLSFYSLTDVLSSKPSLNKSFVSEDPNGLDNALMASATFVDQFFGDFYFRYKCSRVMPLYSVPGLNRI